MKNLLRIAIVVALVSFVAVPVVMTAQIMFNERDVANDSAGALYRTFYLEKFQADTADFDTSIVYDLWSNPFLTCQARGYPLYGEAIQIDTTIDTIANDTTIDTTQINHSDSGGFTVVIMLSNDREHWFDFDSLVVGADTTWGNRKTVTLEQYRYLKYKAHTNADSDSLGVSVEVRQNSGGER